MRIGLVPGSFKPYHVGHDELVRLASSENDLVLVYSSTGNRADISGSAMTQIMNKFVKPSLPRNVRLLSVRVPVGALFQELEYAEKEGSKDVYTIYSDVEDIRKYNKKSMEEYAPNLSVNNQIMTRGVQRGVETTSVSGTKMREYLASGDVRNFKKFLPPSIQRHAAEIISMLRQNVRENLLKSYLKEILRECRINF